jgi:hypothetical protein
MKKVFQTSEEVIHLFAERSQYEATNSSRNVYFEGDKLYSYGSHYTLAEYITNPKKELAVMVDDSGFSVTTSKHIGQTQWALSQYKQFRKTETDPLKVYNQLKYLAKKLKTARSPELYVIPAKNLFETFVEYQEWIGKPYKRKVLELRALTGYSEEGYAINEDLTFSMIRKMYELTQKGKDPVALKEMQAIAKKAAKKAKAAKIKKEQKAKSDWISHKTRTFYSANREDILRISLDGESVETSQGVKVPRKAARVLFKMIEAGKDVKGTRIEQYTVISVNGTLKIGCHNINMDSVRSIGSKL